MNRQWEASDDGVVCPSEPLTAARLAILLVLILFLPLSALTYQLFRSHRKIAKIERILDLLKVRGHEQKKHLEIRTGHYLCISVAYATLVAALGLTILLFGEQMGSDATAGRDPEQFPVPRSWLIFGMGFLGGYLWGIQYVFRRYVDDDLTPGVSRPGDQDDAGGDAGRGDLQRLRGPGRRDRNELDRAGLACSGIRAGHVSQRGISWIYDRVRSLPRMTTPPYARRPSR